MDWIRACWMVLASACLTLGSVHLLIWNQQRQKWAHFSFAFACYALLLVGVFELLMMQAESPQQYGRLLKWGHLPLAVLIIALVAFVRLHLRVGRAWLGHLAWSLRALALIPNFTTGANINFLEVNQLLELTAWGKAQYVAPVGIASPWMALPQLSNVLLVAFFLDAAYTAWRGPETPSRAKVLRICLSMALFVTSAVIWNLVVIVAGVPLPVAVLPAYTGVILVMSYELGFEVVRAAGLADDLAASKAKLRQTQRRIEDAVVAAGLGLWEWDYVSNAIWLSPRARVLLGVQGGEWTHRDQLRGKLDQAALQSLDTAIEPMLSNGGEFLSEFFIRDGAGRPCWLVARGLCDFDPSHKPVTVRGVLVDITARKEVAMQRDALAHLARVGVLAELSGSLAHELNQPLTSILSNAQAAQRFMAHEPPNLEEVRESLASIVESDKRAGEVIRRLRSMLRKEPSSFQEVDLNDVVRAVLRLIRSDLMAKDIEARLDLQADLSGSDGDFVQLQQVVLNLVMNAVDAMQENSQDRVVTVRTRSSPDQGVEVSVSDLGAGIATSDLEHIFTPFMTTKQTGMGLGLPICNTIIQAHGGRLWAVNNAPRGTTLQFWIPAYPKSPEGGGQAL